MQALHPAQAAWDAEAIQRAHIMKGRQRLPARPDQPSTARTQTPRAAGTASPARAASSQLTTPCSLALALPFTVTTR
eukprot:scaffold6612_cov114-Isochrysis_galbana.AAC.2